MKNKLQIQNHAGKKQFSGKWHDRIRSVQGKEKWTSNDVTCKKNLHHKKLENFKSKFQFQRWWNSNASVKSIAGYRYSGHARRFHVFRNCCRHFCNNFHRIYLYPLQLYFSEMCTHTIPANASNGDDISWYCGSCICKWSKVGPKIFQIF